MAGALGIAVVTVAVVVLVTVVRTDRPPARPATLDPGRTPGLGHPVRCDIHAARWRADRDQIAGATLADRAILEFRDTSTSAPPEVNRAVAAGHKVILSPANHAYLDQLYDAATRIGVRLAGPTSVAASYDWDPATLLTGVGEASVLGVEGSLWTET